MSSPADSESSPVPSPSTVEMTEHVNVPCASVIKQEIPDDDYFFEVESFVVHDLKEDSTVTYKVEMEESLKKDTNVLIFDRDANVSPEPSSTLEDTCEEVCSYHSVIESVARGTEGQDESSSGPSSVKLSWRAKRRLKPWKPKEYTCGFCKKVFRESMLLDDHISELHSEKIKFVCRFCKKTFPGKTEYAAHVSSAHVDTAKYKCPNCKVIFQEIDVLRQHIRTEHLGQSLQQLGAPSQPRQNSRLRNKQFICIFCKKGFPDHGVLQYHHKEVHGVQFTKCEHCELAFKTTADLMKHVAATHFDTDK